MWKVALYMFAGRTINKLGISSTKEDCIGMIALIILIKWAEERYSLCPLLKIEESIHLLRPKK